MSVIIKNKKCRNLPEQVAYNDYRINEIIKAERAGDYVEKAELLESGEKLKLTQYNGDTKTESTIVFQGGGVKKEYVDAQDAILAAAIATKANITALDEEIANRVEADEALESGLSAHELRITALESGITESGATKEYVDAAVAAEAALRYAADGEFDERIGELEANEVKVNLSLPFGAETLPLNNIKKGNNIYTLSHKQNKIDATHKIPYAYIDGAPTALIYKGVCLQADLPTSGQALGDYWKLADTVAPYAGQCAIYDGTQFQYSSANVDLSNYYNKTQTDNAIAIETARAEGVEDELESGIADLRDEIITKAKVWGNFEDDHWTQISIDDTLKDIPQQPEEYLVSVDADTPNELRFTKNDETAEKFTVDFTGYATEDYVESGLEPKLERTSQYRVGDIVANVNVATTVEMASIYGGTWEQLATAAECGVYQYQKTAD